MTLLYDEEIKPSFDFSPEALAKEILERGLKEEAFPFDAEISLRIVTEEEIRQLNKTYRNIDSATDVLSFPLIEYECPGDFSCIQEGDDHFNPDTGEAVLGDIVISEAHVHRQADSYGHSEKREYAFLLVHSLLHLLGYDHKTPEEEKEMFLRQERILSKLHIER